MAEKKTPMSNTNVPDLFTASDVARFCSVDLKTIHNWADKGEIKHFRTPGRHLRFRRLDVLDFLRKYGYPVPAIFQQLGAPGEHGKPMIAIIESDTSKWPAFVEALKGAFQVRTFANQTVALVSLGEEPADALVLDTNEVDPKVISHLSTTDRLGHTRCVVWSNNTSLEGTSRSAGAYDFIKRGDLRALKDSVTRILALGEVTTG